MTIVTGNITDLGLDPQEGATISFMVRPMRVVALPDGTLAAPIQAQATTAEDGSFQVTVAPASMVFWITPPGQDPRVPEMVPHRVMIPAQDEVTLAHLLLAASPPPLSAAEEAALQAIESAIAAGEFADLTQADRVQTGLDREAAGESADLSRRYATEEEDVPVVDGEFSSQHYALKANTSAQLSQAWSESPTPPDPDDPDSKSSETWAGISEGFAAQADGFATQAELAALAAGAPIVTTLTTPVPADGTVELLKAAPGLQVHEVVAGAWALRGWLVGPKFDTVALLTANTATTLGPDGQIVEAGGFRYQVAASAATDHHVTTAGGVKLYVLPLSDGSYSIVAFGSVAGLSVGDTSGIAHNTAVFQRCINAASRNNVYTITAPEGHFYFEQVYLYYDATLNPGFDQTESPLRHGRFRFVGGGNLAVSQLLNYAPSYGTILEATGDGIVVSRVGGAPYPARKFEAEGITFVANKAGQYVIEAASCPFMQMKRCSVLQRHVDGHGVLAKSAWFIDYEHTLIFGTVGATGTGVSAGSTIFAGIYTMRNCLVDTWRDCVDWQEGVFVNVSLDNVAIQNHSRDGVRGSGGALHHLALNNVYFEGQSRDHDIRGIGSVIRSLNINRMFVLGGAQDKTSYITDKVIDIDNISNIEINDLYAFRLTKPLCNVTAIDNVGNSSGMVQAIRVVNDFSTPYAGDQVYLFEGVLPTFGEGMVWTGFTSGYRDSSEKIRLFDPETSYPYKMFDRRTGVQTVSALALGQRDVRVGVSTTVTVPSTARYTLLDYTVATSVAVRLPNPAHMPDGRLFLVKNNGASTGIIVVRNNSDSSEVITLQPGQSAVAAFDGASEKFVAYLASTPRQAAIADDESGAGNQATVNNIITALRGAGIILP